MARPQRIEYPGAFYHITSRGNEKGAIFRRDGDRRKFLSLIDVVHQRYGILIHAFSLMRNHYHLLMETVRGHLSRVVHDLNSSYTGYVNAVHERVGHLFQGRFTAILIDTDTYFLELSRYIHLNPVRAKLVSRPEDYPWSGIQYLIGKAKPPEWMNIDFTLRMFAESRRAAMAAYLTFAHEDVGTKSPLENTFAQCILGSEGFIAAVKERHLSADHIGKGVVRAKALSTKVTLDAVARVVSEEIGTDIRALARMRKRSLGLKLFLFLAHKHTENKFRDVTLYLGELTVAAVAQMQYRFAKQVAQDMRLQATIARLESGLR